MSAACLCLLTACPLVFGMTAVGSAVSAVVCSRQEARGSYRRVGWLSCLLARL